MTEPRDDDDTVPADPEEDETEIAPEDKTEGNSDDEVADVGTGTEE